MLGLKDLEIGLMFWAGPDAHATIAHAKSFGLRAGQLGFPGDYSLRGAGKTWDEALRAARFTPVTVVCSYVGEDYADIPTVQNTVGLVPKATRAERVTRTKAVADVGRELGVDSVACHIGFVPEDPHDPTYAEILSVTRDICDHCAKNGQNFTLETGQEPAKVLLQFIADVARPNLKINFDPANMILYGTGDPIEALGVLAPLVVSVHCKDGDWPPRSQPLALGTEKPLGEGSVGMEAFIHKLKEAGYRGILSVEREEADKTRRDADIHKAVKLLRGLTGG